MRRKLLIQREEGLLRLTWTRRWRFWVGCIVAGLAWPLAGFWLADLLALGKGGPALVMGLPILIFVVAVPRLVVELPRKALILRRLEDGIAVGGLRGVRPTDFAIETREQRRWLRAPVYSVSAALSVPGPNPIVPISIVILYEVFRTRTEADELVHILRSWMDDRLAA